MSANLTVNFLKNCFNEIPPNGDPSNYSFTKEELDGFGADGIDGRECPHHWRWYFIENDGRYALDKESLSEFWVETLREEHRLDEPSGDLDSISQMNESEYMASVYSSGRGNVEFRLFFTYSDFLIENPNVSSKEFLVSFTQVEESDRENTYHWTNIYSDNFWEDIKETLINVSGPPQITISEMQDPAAENNISGIKTSIKLFSRENDYSVTNQPQTEENIIAADDSLEISSIYAATKLEDSTHIAYCTCNLRDGDDLHAHCIENGEVVVPSSVPKSAQVILKSKRRVEGYNSRKNRTDGITKIYKPAGISSVILLVPTIIDFLTSIFSSVFSFVPNIDVSNQVLNITFSFFLLLAG